IVARMVVHHRQRMAPPAVGKRNMTLKVHLPKLVGLSHLEAQVSPGATRWRDDPSMPAQDGMHRRVRRASDAVALKAARDLARAPGRMGIAHRQDALLDPPLGSCRARMRTARTVHQLVTGCPSPEPLVPGVAMNPEAAAKLAAVRTFLHRQMNKLTTLIHDR